MFHVDDDDGANTFNTFAIEFKLDLRLWLAFKAAIQVRSVCATEKCYQMMLNYV